MKYQPTRKFGVLYEGTKDDYKIVIVSYGTNPCAYIGLPKKHLLNGVHYDSFSGFNNEGEYLGFPCNGGVTFTGLGIHNELHPNTWFLGWDYAHAGDYVGYYQGTSMGKNSKNKKWTTKQIYEQCVNVIDTLKKVVLHTEMREISYLKIKD